MTEKSEMTEPERPSALPPVTGSEVNVIQKLEPLKAVEWQFPIGCGVATLSITSDEITSEDMDALQEMAALIKRQLERREEQQSPSPAKSVATSYRASNSESGHAPVLGTNPPNDQTKP